MKTTLLYFLLFLFTIEFAIAQKKPSSVNDKRIQHKDTIFCVTIDEKDYNKKQRRRIKQKESYKPNNNFNFEFLLRPLSEIPIALNNIKMRYFFKDNNALRLGLNVRSKNKKYDDPVDTLLNIKEVFFEFGIHPGFEHHLEGTNRLSPYYGVELNFINRFCRKIYKDTTETRLMGSNGNQRAFYLLGLNFFAGADYYITKHIYVGLELGFGLETRINKEVKFEDEDDILYPGEQVYDIGFDYVNAFRIGYLF